MIELNEDHLFAKIGRLAVENELLRVALARAEAQEQPNEETGDVERLNEADDERT